MKLLFVGDVNIGEYYLTFGHGPRTKSDRFDIFENVRPLLQSADILVGNLEAPLTSHGYNKKDPESSVLRGDPSKASYLREIGFNVFQVANNHIVQHGREGFAETIKVLEENGIATVGKQDEPTWFIKREGMCVGFLAASDVPDNTDKAQTSYQSLSPDFISKVKRAVAQVDHLFVLLHWGLEASTSPMEYQAELMEELRIAGVRGVIGSHPHLFYPVSCHQGFIAAPSLGNFLFDLCWDGRLLKTGILEINLQKDSVEAKVWPVELKDDGCIPIISGDAIKVEGTVSLYDLKEAMKYQQVKKVVYFAINLFKGNTYLKLKFIVKKLGKTFLFGEARDGRK